MGEDVRVRQREEALRQLYTASNLEGVSASLDRRAAGRFPQSAPEPERMIHLAEWSLRARQVLHQVFNEEMLNYPFWDILLISYLAQSQGRSICVKQIWAHMREPRSSLLRHIDTLESKGLIVRTRDRYDARRRLITLTPAGLAGMRRYFSLVGEQLDQELLS